MRRVPYPFRVANGSQGRSGRETGCARHFLLALRGFRTHDARGSVTRCKNSECCLVGEGGGEHVSDNIGRRNRAAVETAVRLKKTTTTKSPDSARQSG
jgi:hypothetical protein